jgi:hypothetical protein
MPRIGEEEKNILPKMPLSLKSFTLKSMISRRFIGNYPENFSLAVLSVCTNLEKIDFILSLTTIDLDDIKNCSNLSTVLLHTKDIDNLRRIEKLPLLSKLRLFYQTEKPFLKLKRCPILKEVILISTILADISCLNNCLSLETVKISSRSVEDITPLSTCYNLRSISILQSKKLRDISSLAKLSNLKYFKLFLTDVERGVVKDFENKTGIKINTSIAEFGETVMETPD